MMDPKHALVIGGTGMLRNVSTYLAKHDYAVSVVGRTAGKLKQVMENSPPHSIFPIQADYNSDSFLVEISEAIKKRGPFALIVSWTPNYQVVERVCSMNEHDNPFRLIHVKGSRRYFQDELVNIPFSCMREVVYLGFIQEETGSRWLTNEEISGGVIGQIESGGVGRIVGQLHPYDRRPE
ncbi:short-chain dehydrogenase [Sporosarcina cyprini]|uniref:short-chain dehydrogenase n=1 Tax=Sporosarcina cyprini TaxID=2910523 RepID=UPI001EE1178B|nr:short-chain dehydrogenase [Sporosarcina cyprini]MCG3087495.1 short-chain dehydrogenase [Sporosarcina cyprini]